MESLEHAARILLLARLLGRVNALSAAAIEELILARHRAYDERLYPGYDVSTQRHDRGGEGAIR
ncbi:MAG TPA: hypothetical protein VNL96_07635, partial [Gemmatimonadaceae bacterium]|nr:hypothetical protein [Gemmatimonadaceae bacterium]